MLRPCVLKNSELSGSIPNSISGIGFDFLSLSRENVSRTGERGYYEEGTTYGADASIERAKSRVVGDVISYYVSGQCSRVSVIITFDEVLRVESPTSLSSMRQKDCIQLYFDRA